MLKLRKGFKRLEATPRPSWSAVPNGGHFGDAFVDIDENGKAYAFPHGGFDCEEFDTIDEAHAYLIERGSESPFEESV